MLDLRLVPATVERRVDGASGSLQFEIADSVDHRTRIEQDIRDQGWCPLLEQYQLMWVFDALIYNVGRSDENVLYSVDDWTVHLVDHSRAFATERGLPPRPADRPLEVTAEFARRLAGLDRDALDEALRGLLDRQQLRALQQRRDRLLREARSGDEGN